MREKLFPAALSGVEKITHLFVKELSYDISRRFGMVKHCKDRAKELLDNSGISKVNYEKLLSMTYLDKPYSPDKLDDLPIKDTEELNQYGYVIDSSKSKLGLMKVKESEQHYSGGKRVARRAFAYRNNSEDDEYEDESEEESEEENSDEDTHRIKTKRKKLNINEYYTGNALKNILHMILGVA